MKLELLSLLGAVLLPFTLSSCSLFGIPTMNDLKRAEQSSFQRGQQAGRASQVRAAYHQAQLEKERPAPPVPTRYYEVEVPSHVASDGVKIEAHKLTLAVVR